MYRRADASEEEPQLPDREIADLQQQIEQLQEQGQALVDARRQDQVSDDFLRKLQQAIVFVAESEGYTIVLRTDTVGIQWWSPVVDITDSVLRRLEQIFGR